MIFLKRISQLLLLMSLLLAVCTGLLLGASGGLNWLLLQVDKALPGTLQITHLQGHLFGKLRLEGFRYADEKQRISADTLELIWTPTALFSGVLHIERLAADALRIELLKQDAPAAPSPEAPAGIEGFHLPLSLRIDALELSDAHIRYDLASDPIELAKATLRVHSEADRLQIETLRLDIEPTQQAAAGHLDVTGYLQTSDLRFDLSGQWRNLRWPLSQSSPQVLSKQGRISAGGQLEDYLLSLSAAVEGPDIPAGDWSLESNGSLQGLSLQKLSANILGGRLAAAGQLAWFPAVSWNASISGEDIDPSHYVAELPGKLALKLQSEGEISERNSRISATLSQLSGVLHGAPVKGGGQVDWSPEALKIDQLQLTSGKAHFDAHGEIAKQWNLAWRLSAPDLAKLLPSAGGHIESKGVLSGSPALPALQAHLKAGKLRYRDQRIKQLQAKLAIDPHNQSASIVTIKGSGLFAEGQHIEQLNLHLDGLLKDHKISAELTQKQGSLHLAASGGYQNGRWQGRLAQLRIAKTPLGDWKLEKAVDIDAGEKQISLSALCLHREAAKLCAEAHWSKGSGALKAELDALPLTWLRPLLPPDMHIADTLANGRANIQLTPQPLGQLSMTLSPGVLSVRPHPEHRVRLHFQGGDLQANVGRDGLQAKLQLHMEDDGIEAQAHVNQAIFAAEPLSAALDGHIALKATQLGVLSALVPELEETTGDISADLTLSGSLGEPHVAGELQLEHGHVALPIAGIELKELTLRAIADSRKGQRIDLDGSLMSGGGKAELAGYLELDPAKGLPAELSVKGERVQVVHLPFAQVFANPDLTLGHSSAGTRIRGSVLIPKARITPKQLPASTRSTSSDLVVLNEKHEQQAIQSLGPDIQVTLRLGEDVHFSGFDFSAYIDGHLEVIGHPQQAMIGNGQLLIRDGRYQTHHTTLTVERGRINFSQSPIDNPALNIRTVRQIDDVQVGVEIGGRAQEPTLKLFSTPSMPQKDILSYLATGEALDTGSFSTRGALTSLGVLGTNMLAGDLGKELGIDEIALESDSDDIKDSKVRLGKHISENLSIGVRVGLDPEDTEVTAAYRFDRHWEVDASTSLASSALDAKFTIDIK